MHCKHIRMGKCEMPCMWRRYKRETGTMPQWAGYSWYFLRYIDPNNNDILLQRKNLIIGDQ